MFDRARLDITVDTCSVWQYVVAMAIAVYEDSSSIAKVLLITVTVRLSMS